ncbi:dihydrofolate reductase-like [Saccoglossus kowalevskii]
MKTIIPIAAVCNDMGIGVNGMLPWDLPKESDYYNRITSDTKKGGKQNAVVMGRKTWNSLPGRLDGRYNVVLSRHLKERPTGVDLVATSLVDAVKQLSDPPLADKVDKVFILGGSGIYKESVESPLCFRIYLTRIMADYECDTFFPEFNTNLFHLVSDPDVPCEIQEEKGIQYKFEVYEKKV